MVYTYNHQSPITYVSSTVHHAAQNKYRISNIQEQSTAVIHKASKSTDMDGINLHKIANKYEWEFSKISINTDENPEGVFSAEGGIIAEQDEDTSIVTN